jgi:hypothetical protein
LIIGESKLEDASNYNVWNDCHVVLYILELQNGTHFEILDFNMYIMQSIGWNIYKIVEVMNFNTENQNLLYQQQLVDGLWFGSTMDLNTC